MTTPNHHQEHREGIEQRSAGPASRGGILTLWIILGVAFFGAVGQLLGMALPGDFAYGGAIGLGVGIAVGAAIGTRRADANDREIVRRAEENHLPTDL
ncbi:hypothetical protein GCM10023160_05330 [Brachybacterium paraconglomeratum]|uniref:hypothetical protein n=1 Tax=Brachybacterium paraconglomeratum TaxID=173362 RepID=UPI0031E7F871